MENWMQKFEKRKDDSREKELNQILKELFGYVNANVEKLKVLKGIV